MCVLEAPSNGMGLDKPLSEPFLREVPVLVASSSSKGPNEFSKDVIKLLIKK